MVGFVEEELGLERINGKVPPKNYIAFPPGKYRYYIHAPDDPVCADKNIIAHQGGRNWEPYVKYKTYCISWEKIDQFEAKYSFGGGFERPFSYPYSSISYLRDGIIDRQSNQFIGQHIGILLDPGLLELKFSIALLGDRQPVSRCNIPPPPSAKLFVGWE